MSLSYITGGNTTLEFYKKRKQITGTFGITAAGKFLHIQLILVGKNQRCHPKGIPFPGGFDVINSKNHWSNETLTIHHLDNIIIPYFEVICEELVLPEDQKCLLIYDVFKAQTTLRMYKYHQI